MIRRAGTARGNAPLSEFIIGRWGYVGPYCLDHAGQLDCYDIDREYTFTHTYSDGKFGHWQQRKVLAGEILTLWSPDLFGSHFGSVDETRCVYRFVKEDTLSVDCPGRPTYDERLLIQRDGAALRVQWIDPAGQALSPALRFMRCRRLVALVAECG